MSFCKASEACGVGGGCQPEAGWSQVVTTQALSWKGSYTRTGSIFLAQTQDRLISLKHISSRLNVIGIPCEIVSPRRVAELHPLLNVHDLVGTMHVPEDAVVSSADVALALASAASQNGSWTSCVEKQDASATHPGGLSTFLSGCISALLLT
ncbi:pyruvate dehydrogenase phosphatase regulatory subunit, mitochondrial-like [Muntiacus reevesi]|uniref:pyruvate dehydrogenase phosphatase regulatory subunit, mitochondrial-like n=1 Tax=Muntiacus reevesi TaxID=9886 RepID=UPI0033075D17